MEYGNGQLRGWRQRLAPTIAGLCLAACGGSAEDGQPTKAGSGGAAAGSAATAGGGAGQPGGGAAGQPGGGAAGLGGDAGGAGTCEGPTPTLRPQSGRLELPIKLTVGSEPIATGTSATAPDGREFQLSMLKLFLTQPVLLDSAGKETHGQIVGADGQPLPYGVQLIDVDDATTQLWRIAAAEGSYSRLKFGVGVPPSCNSPSNTNLVYPLNPDGEMFWTWGSQFLFVRVEGMTRPAPSEQLAPFAYHVGFDAAFAHISVEGALTISGISPGPTLALDVARMLATGAASLPTPQHAVPEGWVADNLEQNGAFSLQ